MQLCVSVILFVPISVSGLTIAGGYFLTSEAPLPFYTTKISLGDSQKMCFCNWIARRLCS